eukprot:sb/3466633/
MPHVWVATDLGSLRGVDFKTEQNTVVTYDELSPRYDIASLRYSTSGGELYCTLRQDLVNVFDVNEGIYVNQYEVEGKLVTAFDVGEALLTCTRSGQVLLWKDDEIADKLKVGSEDLECCEKVSDTLIATAGKEQELKLWDLETQKSVWQSKNVPRDELDLRVPVWARSLCEMGDSGGNVFCVGTQYHQLRLYDRRTKRRPVQELNWGELPVTCITSRGDNVFFGNGKGDLTRVDVRAINRDVVKYKGAAGGLRGVAVHRTEPFLASVGLDRHLRVHDINTREMVHKFYLKHKLNCAVFTSERVREKEEEDEEDVWEILDGVKRRKIDDNEG